MKRRSFVKASVLTGAVTGIAPLTTMASSLEKQKKMATQFYELRTYLLKDDKQQKLVEDYFKQAAIPALNRLGCSPVGLFTELKPQGQTKVYVLIPYSSLDNFLTIQDKLAHDSDYQQKGAAYLNAPATEPAYERIESSLLQAFAGMPKIQVPPTGPRIFELRRYESASESAGKKKIEMFNDKGELAIFKRTGLRAVFFGETLIGQLRPKLTYMLTYKDMEDHDQHWKQFGTDPEWKQISSIPEYADAKIVSHITSIFLTPVEGSQI